MSRVRIQIVRRLAGLLLLAVAPLPWFMEEHPSAQESCLPPLVWLGEGRCACRPSLVSAFGEGVKPGQHAALVLLLPPALAVAATLLLLLAGERRGVRAVYLAAWGLAGAYSFLLFIGHWFISHGRAWLWGAALGGLIAVAMVAWEVLAARANRRKARRPRSGE